MVVEVDAASGVLHHVFHNPVGREDLSGRWDLVSFSFVAVLEGSEDFVFLLRDIELIEPANQFGLAVVVISEIVGIVEQVDEIAIDEDVVWQEQFGVASDAAETSLQDGMVVAIGCDKDLELLEESGVVINDFIKLLAVGGHKEIVFATTRIVDDARHLDSRVVVFDDRLNDAVLLKDAQSHKTVEPGVGGFLTDIIKTYKFDAVI